MGNTCIPVADSFRYMAKPLQYCKVKKKKKKADILKIDEITLSYKAKIAEYFTY